MLDHRDWVGQPKLVKYANSVWLVHPNVDCTECFNFLKEAYGHVQMVDFAAQSVPLPLYNRHRAEMEQNGRHIGPNDINDAHRPTDDEWNPVNDGGGGGLL